MAVRMEIRWEKDSDGHEVPVMYPVANHPTIKAIFFDLDGVLVDAADWHKDAFNKAMVYFGVEPLSEEEHHNIYNGLSTRKKLEMLIAYNRFANGNWGIKDEEVFINTFYDKKQEYTIETIQEKCRPVERVYDAVEYALKEGFRLAVVTNCSRHTCELMLKLSGLDRFFEFIIANEDVEGRVKPHPRPYLEARWKMELKSKEALAVDDTWKGINSARDAWCRTWKLDSFNELSKEKLAEVLDKYKYSL